MSIAVIVLCGCETWPLTFRKDLNYSCSENEISRKIFIHKCEEIHEYLGYYIIRNFASYAGHLLFLRYEGVSKSFRTGRLDRELQLVQLSATRYSCIAIL
jgi:hypothetical protein